METTALSLLPCELPLSQEEIDASRFHFHGSPRQGSFRGHAIEEHPLPIPEGYTVSLACSGGPRSILISVDSLSVFSEPGEGQRVDLLSTARGFEALAASQAE